jgi:hypothetical protein
MICKGSEFENSGNNTTAVRQTSREAIRGAFTRRHPPIQAPSRVESLQARQHLQQHF